MAHKGRVHKLNLQVSDLDHHHYETHKLTLAQHPSETEYRLGVRLAVFAFWAFEAPEFTRGLCAAEEPELWVKDRTGAITRWIDLGQPEPKRLAQACGKSAQVDVYAYQNSTPVWAAAQAAQWERLSKLAVYGLTFSGDSVESLIEANGELIAQIQDGGLWLSRGDLGCSVEVEVIKAR